MCKYSNETFLILFNMLLKTDKMIFATDEDAKLEHYGNEQLLTEYNGQIYRISIDRTTIAPYYQLFVDYKEGLRKLTTRLFATSSRDKLVAFINNNIN